VRLALGPQRSYWLCGELFRQPHHEGHWQVTEAEFDMWKKELANARASFNFYPALTHLFMPGAGSSPASLEDYSLAGNVSEGVIMDIARWIKSTAAAHSA
jgi:hypothetical protein